MDVVEGLINVVVLLTHWRVIVCLIGAALVAFALAQGIPWFTGLQGVFIALVGAIPGVMWQAKAEAGNQPVPALVTSPFVIGLSAFFVGVIWGSASSTSLASAITGAVFLIGALLAWHYHAVVKTRRLNQSSVTGCGIVAIGAYVLIVGANLYIL